MKNAAALLLLALAGCGSPTPSDRPKIPVTPLPREATAPPPDAEDRDRHLRRQVRRAVGDRPALQRLPWLERHLAIDIDGVTTDGSLVLLVRSDLDPSEARRAYAAFLERADDDGRAYLPTFLPAD